MTVYSLLAEAYRYPAPGRLASLQSGLSGLPSSPAQHIFASFLEAINSLSLEEWEVLHTRTLDLNPPAAPYAGFQTWGENYSRGEFMSRLNRALYEAGVDCDGELPDHLTPVLRYLEADRQPLPELLEILPRAVERCHSVLRKAEPDNPYTLLFEATLHACRAFHPAQTAPANAR